MTEPRHLDLVDRLRGNYHLPVNDGAGPLNGSMTFSRQFETPPIQKQAADEIERLRNGFHAIKKAALEGRVCDDVAWFDDITTLYDFCELVLNKGFADQQSTAGSPK